ncbi:MAG: helix-turn-helix transcriptional regulator [Spirochaetes bacterium]|nr:helix-turn-helix transcriptional regulator [Spirochaetota bacterium]
MKKIDLKELNLNEKEEKILQSSIKLFSEKGFSAATSKEIAKDAGVSEGIIFKYFKTKKDILKAILLHLINILSEKIVLKGIKDIFKNDKECDIKTVLKKVIYDRIKMVDKIYPMAQIIFMEAILHEEIRDAVYNNIIKKAMEIFNDFYFQMAEKNILRKNVDIMVVFRSILSNIAIFIAQKKIFGKYFKFENIDKEIDKVIDVILNGITVQ